LKKILKELEWSNDELVYFKEPNDPKAGYVPACPVCHGIITEDWDKKVKDVFIIGHRPNCRLDKLLKEK
jgi:hypothetical protein